MNKQLIPCLAGAFLVALCIVSCKKDPIPEDPGTPLKPANSFIISSPGTYSFMPVKGNSTESVGSVAKVEVLWETFGTDEQPKVGDVVAGTKYIADKDIISFTMPKTLHNGNALIAAKDASGNILWSWHVWVCNGWDPDKTAHSYYNNPGVAVMDRNLGATTATPNEVTSFGLHYQWGRKDPFLGANRMEANVFDEDATASSTLQWPRCLDADAEIGTIEFAVAHPTTFIVSTPILEYNTGDWYYTEDGTTDNTRWQEEKTIYDPCPAGWQVPTGGPQGLWTKACGGKDFFSVDRAETDYGANLTLKFGDADLIWYPFAGSVDGAYEEFYRHRSVGSTCTVWTVTPEPLPVEFDPQSATTIVSPYFNHKENGVTVYPNANNFRYFGQSVRCVKYGN